MKAAIYCRVSTSMQEEANSLENQVDRCKMFCNMRQFEVVKVYTDVETGINDERFEFLELKKAASRKEFDVVIVTELQRLSRKLTTLLSFVIELEEYQVGFISISQNFDTTSAIGRAMLKLIGVFAEFEREQISERVSNTMKNLSIQGKWVTGTVPYGYRMVDGLLQVHEKEAEVIREMFNMFAAGKSRLYIANHFNFEYSSVVLRHHIHINAKL